MESSIRRDVLRSDNSSGHTIQYGQCHLRMAAQLPVASTKITDVTMKFYPRLILASDEAEYDSIWEDFLSEFNAIDLDAYQTEIDRQIELKMGK